MGALLDKASAVQHQNLVGAADGFQPVGNHTHRFLMGQGLDEIVAAGFLRRCLHLLPGGGGAAEAVSATKRYTFWITMLI